MTNLEYLFDLNLLVICLGLKILADQFPNIVNRPKPKHHFLTHFPQAIGKYGPAVGFWSARFESKHQTAKSLTHFSKNFKNIENVFNHV